MTTHGQFLSSGKVILPITFVAALLSGFRAGDYSTDHLWSGAPPLVLALLLAWAGGSLLGPALFSWLPGRSAAFKGAMAGGLALILWPAACLPLHLVPLDVTMAILVIPTLSSFLTSWHWRTREDGGEWRKAAPLQLAPIALATGIWIMARFI